MAVRATPSPTSSAPVSTKAPTPAHVYGTQAPPILVQVTGLVLADKSGDVVMCPPFPVAGVGTTSKQTPTPPCQGPIPVTGVDLDLVTQPGHNSTHRWGQTHVTARWDGSSLTVRSQRLPTEADRDRTGEAPDGVACPAPAGGWASGSVQDDPAIQQVQAAVGADFGALAMGYPHGGPTNTDGTNPSYGLQDTEQVLVVGVTGDIVQATAAIRKVFKGNLCVVRSTTTGAQIEQQDKQIIAALDDHWADLGVMMTAEIQEPLGTSINTIDVVVDTPQLEKMLAGIAGPAVLVNAWIKPVA